MHPKHLMQPAAAVALLSLGAPSLSQADVLCKIKKTGAVIARTACKKKEVAIASIDLSSASTASAADSTTAATIALADSGPVSSGSDFSTGLDVSVTRSGASGGTFNNTGVNIAVTSDGGGDATNVGLSVLTSGADTNYTAIFQGGNVGIGVSDPDELLELAGRLHLGQTSAPSSTANKLYNIGGTLYWAGQQVGVGNSNSGTITAVTAGTGLTGGGTSGNVSLSVDAGTTANKILRLNSSAQIPSVSGVNLTSLNASALGSGTVPDARLSSNVSLLGSSINLGTEVTGTLPVGSGGTGATSLSNLIALSTHTTGNYVASVATSGGLSGGAAGSEGAALTLSVDQSFTPTWTGLHSFQGGVNIGTTTASAEQLHLNGRIQLEPGMAPGTTTDKLYNVGGELYFNGLNISQGALGGDITSVVAGTGLSGGGTSGTVTLNVDVGTGANQIVALNGSSQLPAVSGVNLTSLNASNIASGTLSASLLPAAVSQLGSSIGLTTEVTGILPVANGGTGAASLANLIALGTNTTGNYVAAVAQGDGITVGSTGVEGGTATISLDEAFAPTWTDTHTFSGAAPDITTAAGGDFSIVPDTGGFVGIGTNSPGAMLDTILIDTSATAGTSRAARVSLTDSGLVNSGSDQSLGLVIDVTRTGATGGTINSTGLDLTVAGDTGGASTAVGLDVMVSGADTNYAALFNGGSVGVGTSVPSARLHSALSSTSTTGTTETAGRFDLTDSGIVASGADTSVGLDVNVSRTAASGGTIDSTGIDINVTADTGGTSKATGLTVQVSGADTNVAATFSGGSVGVGDIVAVESSNVPSGSIVVGNGTLCVDNGGNNCDDASRNAGTIYAVTNSVTGIDVAENFPIEQDDTVSAGDIVIINTHQGQKCLETSAGEDGMPTCSRTEAGNIPFVTRAPGKADGATAKRVIGVVSTKPGLVLGGYGQDELILYRSVPVALAGRVPVKVSNENGAIEVGDRIIPSSEPGVGMRADGTSAGTIGIALEPYEGSENGEVLVLIRPN